MLFLKKHLRELTLLHFCFFAFILLAGCEPKDSYPYQKGLNAFMDETFNVRLNLMKEEQIFLFIDGSCDECIQNKFDGVKEYIDTHNINIVLLGDTSQLKISRSILDYEPLVDPSPRYQVYETGIGLPLLIKLKNGHSTKYMFVAEDNLKEILNVLN